VAESRASNREVLVLPGDGIGPEIVAETIKVLGRLALKFEFEQAAQFRDKIKALKSRELAGAIVPA
jgi:isocitrate/isopropylmalate dehydrogenase